MGPPVPYDQNGKHFPFAVASLQDNVASRDSAQIHEAYDIVTMPTQYTSSNDLATMTFP
jgi:hypothetical protein